MKTRHLLAALAAVFLATAAQTAVAKQVVAEFSGSSSSNTRQFDVQSPWLMEWQVSGDEGQYEVIEISLVDASTGMYQGIAVKSKTAGEGLRLFKEGGEYYFRVNSSLMNWHIKVSQLSEEEAEEYKAKD